MKLKEETEKAGLRLNIQKMKIMASGSITSWQIDVKTMETDRLYFLGLQITADGDCSHEIKRPLLLGRKPITNLLLLLLLSCFSCVRLCATQETPPGSPVPGILQATTLEWVSISFSNA